MITINNALKKINDNFRVRGVIKDAAIGHRIGIGKIITMYDVNLTLEEHNRIRLMAKPYSVWIYSD